MLVAFQDKVAVPEIDLIHLSAMLDNQRSLAALFAENAIKRQNFGAYLEDRSMFERADELLKLSMFDGYRDECKEVFPEYEDRLNENVFEDMTIDYAFSDGSLIDDTVDVPF